MMQKVEIIDRAGDDGMLHVAIPVDEPSRRYQVTVYVRPMPTSAETAIGPGWPPGFFEQTAGSIQDESFVRHDQGQYEKRLGFE